MITRKNRKNNCLPFGRLLNANNPKMNREMKEVWKEFKVPFAIMILGVIVIITIRIIW